MERSSMIMEDEDHDTMIGIGSPLSEGKMVIKLKIPKLSTAAIEGERSSMTSTEDIVSLKKKKEEGSKRVCLECNKEFSSGKALGGHMRIHVQSNNNRNTFLKPSKTTKFKKKDLINNGDDHHGGGRRRKPNNYKKSVVNGEGNPKCSLCGKIFPSMKSLFGHMRCHPERLWRGIVPPPDTPTTTTTTAVFRRSSSSNSSSSTFSENGLNFKYEDDGDDQVVDLTKFVKGWTVTEKRGRRSLKEAANDDEDEVLMEAVEDLMSLAHSGPPSMADSDFIIQRQLQPVEVFEGTNSSSPTNKDDKIDENSKEFGKRKEEIEVKPVVKLEVDDDGTGLKNFSDNESDSCKYKKNPFNKIKKRKKMKLMMELEKGFTQVVVTGGGLPPVTVEVPESKYKCTTCNKSFASHQALGGHRSSHNKSKITLIDHQEDDNDSFVMNQISDNVEIKEVEFSGDGTTVAPASSVLHQCKICYKFFPTGQALGGPKRCHWSGAIEALQAPSSQVTSTGEAGSQTDGGGGGGGGRRRILDFDLNEVPTAAMMEDEGGNGGNEGNGNGYASSSYNSNMG